MKLPAAVLSSIAPLAALALALAASGCSGSRGAGRAIDGPPTDGGADLRSDGPGAPDAQVDVDADAGTGADGPAADGPSADAPPALVPPPHLLAYQAFLEARVDTYQARWTECFGVPAAALTPGERVMRGRTARMVASFRLGLVAFDQRAAADCLAGIQRATCDQVAEMFVRDEVEEPGDHLLGCSQVLTGRVPEGQPCLDNGDCSDRTHRCDNLDRSTRCTVCQPAPRPLPLGADCSGGNGDCPRGSRCRLAAEGAPTLQCTQPGQRGAFCLFQGDCGQGLFCSHTVADELEGTCQPHRAGEPCAGDWQCIGFLACLGAAPGVQGRCGQPRRLGEPCQVLLSDVNRIPHSDCSLGLTCVDLDGQGPRCVLGAAVGETCGELPADGGGRAYLDCTSGFCERAPDQKLGRCRALRPEGEPCQHDGQCAARLLCAAAPPNLPSQPRTCRRPATPGAVNELCRIFDNHCAEGLFCRSNDPDGAFELGTCQPLRRTGEACRLEVDLCEPLSQCLQGVCTRC
jgi:hypothetical protein